MFENPDPSSLRDAQQRGRVPASGQPTIWGLTPREVHDRYWAARGIQVVRPGGSKRITRAAPLYLLTGRRWLAIFRTAKIVSRLSWERARAVVVTLSGLPERGYWEEAISEGRSGFVGFHRHYDVEDVRFTRIVLTCDPNVARAWQEAEDPQHAWERLAREVPDAEQITESVSGQVYDGRRDEECARFLRSLTHIWRRPGATIRPLGRVHREVWKAPDALVDASVRFVGPVWIGSGRRLSSGASVVGPAILWDDRRSRPQVEEIPWKHISLTARKDGAAEEERIRGPSPFALAGKRAFDILFSLAALAVTLPFYPIVMLLIWLDDGRPFFFAHKRETLGGKPFPCIKFRSMRKDAEEIKAKLVAENQVDGPQFYIENDPRLLRIGKFIRKVKIDEWPQFVNVLLGHMSIVGPRPSPFEENQFCPAWREARLSVRPGITGLWQVSRTREPDLDFQEWIRYDLEYVDRMSWKLDLWILWRTLWVMLRGD